MAPDIAQHRIPGICCPEPSCDHELAPKKCSSCGATCPCGNWEVVGGKNDPRKRQTRSPEQRRNVAFGRLGKPLPEKHKENIRKGVERAKQEGRFHPDGIRRCDKIPKEKSARPTTIEALTTVCNNPSGDPDGLDLDFIENQVQQLHWRRS